ncbi:Molybdopterin synthase catalytic subunit [Roseibaca ekhonensis]|jgi:molybdopterin synthase catalytic subunit|uniref:Molybdopterin synthase catalytic subunit n=1 Tax=Roseinatronobacter ekhonensis TaxID=254356 RepID=A0A3B0MTG0_9RHOB|nr:molybdenum cofactor biosynthesis protein MoaE [Roseibaca ekhonensis]SUZ32124.1 Molybdopterin synthase catalytic subunit [Roseibaca ekhonensis]
MLDIRVQAAPFDYGTECSNVAKGMPDIGAVVTFCGIVRNNDSGTLQQMEIEHYPGMTERALEKIAMDATGRWDLGACKIIHRFGPLAPGEIIMMVATASAHRADAFAAADFLMDYLKSRAPFWKKERTAHGAEWVAAKDSDETALTRW